MIMLLAEVETQNVLHIVQGPESDLQCAVQGSIVVNISALLAQMNGDKPVLLHFTRCESEAAKAAQLAELTTKGAIYPFHAQTAVFGPKAKLEAAVQLAEEQKKLRGEVAPQAEPCVAAKGACTRCGLPNATLVPALAPAICYDCAKIDLGLAKARSKPQVG